MSHNPPPVGWVDPNGTYQPGRPPPGFWQASDGRWYPPQPVRVEPPAPSPFVAGPPGLGQPGQPAPVNAPYPSYTPAPTGSGRSAAPVVVLGVAAAIFVLVLGAVVAVALIAADDGSSETATELGTDGQSSTEQTGSGEGLTPASSTETSGGTLPVAGGPDEPTCVKLDDETLEIDLVNTTAEVATFNLTIAYLDGEGQRLGDTFAYVNALRPGERTVQPVYLYEEGTDATQCEVIDVDETPTLHDAAAATDISTCEITGADFIGDVAATLSATNSEGVDNDYSIEVALLDPAGIRRGNGWAFIEHVRAGETAPADIFTTTDYGDGYACEVVAVTRTAST